MRLKLSQTALFLLAILAGLWLCTASGHIAAAEVKRPELLLPLGHTMGISSVAMSGDGRRVLTGSGDQTAILWDAETARPLQTFKGHTGSVLSVALSRDSTRVLTGSADNTAILWDARYSAKPLQTFKRIPISVTSVARADDGIADPWPHGVGGQHRDPLGRGDRQAAPDLQGAPPSGLPGRGSGTPVAAPAPGDRSIRWRMPRMEVALSGDGKRVLTGSFDKTAILWDAETAKPLRTFKGHSDELWSVALSGDGKWAVTGSRDGTAILWDTETDRPLQIFKAHTESVNSVALSGDGKRVLTGSFDGGRLDPMGH